MEKKNSMHMPLAASPVGLHGDPRGPAEAGLVFAGFQPFLSKEQRAQLRTARGCLSDGDPACGLAAFI